MYGCGEPLDAPCPCRWSASHCGRSRPLVRWQMAEMVLSDLLMKRGSSPAPRGLLTAFGQTRSQDALAPQVLHRLVRRRAARRPAAPLHARSIVLEAVP